jgi:hypothetical protein
MKEPISIKPHHFVDIIASFGGEEIRFEPHPYGHAVHIVAAEILQDPDTVLRIELGADDICQPCRHNIDGSCDDTIDTSFRPAAPESKSEWNLLIDQRWCERLGIREGATLSARDLCRRIRDSVDDMRGIYEEIPYDRIEDRQARLRRGISTFLNA